MLRTSCIERGGTRRVVAPRSRSALSVSRSSSSSPHDPNLCLAPHLPQRAIQPCRPQSPSVSVPGASTKRYLPPLLPSSPPLRLTPPIQLHYLARNYPDPTYPIHERLHSCFLAHVGADDAKVEAGILKAEFIKKELEALYFLKKYRAMKGRYYPD